MPNDQFDSPEIPTVAANDALYLRKAARHHMYMVLSRFCGNPNCWTPIVIDGEPFSDEYCTKHAREADDDEYRRRYPHGELTSDEVLFGGV